MYSYSLFPLFAFAHIFKNKILVENFYLEHYRTLFLVFIPTTLYLSFKSKTFYKNRLLRLLFFVGFVYITSFIIVMNRTLQPTHEYILSKKISEFIQADAKQLNIGIQDKQWIILDQSDWAETGWFSPSLWYFFPQEEKDDHLFLRNNLLFQTKGEATVIYLLCHHFFDSSYTPINLSSPIDINEICLDEFIAHEEYSPYNYLSENFAKKTL